MSGVKRYMHISPLCEAAPLLMANYPMATEYVLASDYDRDTQALKAEIERYIQEGIKIADQRDALRAQVEAMRAAPANERAAAFEACPESNCDWGAFYRGWMARAALQAKP